MPASSPSSGITRLLGDTYRDALEAGRLSVMRAATGPAGSLIVRR